MKEGKKVFLMSLKKGDISREFFPGASKAVF
jgi:hypothetical protein